MLIIGLFEEMDLDAKVIYFSDFTDLQFWFCVMFVVFCWIVGTKLSQIGAIIRQWRVKGCCRMFVLVSGVCDKSLGTPFVSLCSLVIGGLVCVGVDLYFEFGFGYVYDLFVEVEAKLFCLKGFF